MKKSYQIYTRQIEMGVELTLKWYKLGVKNEFETYEQVAWFIQNPANSHLFNIQTDYTIKEIYQKPL